MRQISINIWGERQIKFTVNFYLYSKKKHKAISGNELLCTRCLSTHLHVLLTFSQLWFVTKDSPGYHFIEDVTWSQWDISMRLSYINTSWRKYCFQRRAYSLKCGYEKPEGSYVTVSTWRGCPEGEVGRDATEKKKPGSGYYAAVWNTGPAKKVIHE